MPILDKSNKKQVTKYKEFLEKNEYTRLTQALEWANVKFNWIQEAVYIEENNEIVGAMTILIKKIPHINKSLMYASRGPVCRPDDIEVIKRLVKEAEPLAKKYNAFCLKFDPQIDYSDELNILFRSNGFKTSRKS